MLSKPAGRVGHVHLYNNQLNQHLAIGMDAEATMKGAQDPVALTTLICQFVLGAMGATPEAWKRALVLKPLLLLNSMLFAQRLTEAAEVVTRLPEPRET
jgi:hypothetical protein